MGFEVRVASEERREGRGIFHSFAEVLKGEDDARIRILDLRGQARNPAISKNATQIRPFLALRHLVKG